jgi:hypothetical protein
MGRHAETKLFESQKLNSPNGKNWYMIQGRPTGKRERYYFATEKKAKKAAADRNRQLTAFGSQTTLPEAERVMAAECIKMLVPFGKTLYDATHFYRNFLREETSSISVTKLCEIVGEEFEKRLSNGGATLRHKRTMDSCLKKFEARFGASPIKTLTGAEIKEWLPALPDTKVKTQNNLLGYIRNVYGIALEKELISEDPLQYVKSFPQSEKFEKEPTPLTPEEAERLLNAAEPSVYQKKISKEATERFWNLRPSRG